MKWDGDVAGLGCLIGVDCCIVRVLLDRVGGHDHAAEPRPGGRARLLHPPFCHHSTAPALKVER